MLGVRVGVAIDRARQLGVLTRSPEAEQRWADIYNAMADDVDGVVGSLTARAEAQLLRLSVVFAMLDASDTIEVVHLDAAQAVWEHTEATVNRVFAGHESDWIVPRLLEALTEAGSDGLDGSAQRDLFNRHLDGARLAAAHAELEAHGVARTVLVETGGRPRLLTRLVTVDSSGPSDEEDRDPVESGSSRPADPLTVAGAACERHPVSEAHS